MYWNFYFIDIFYYLLNWIFLNISPLQIWCWMICKTWIIIGVVGVVVTECPSLFCVGLLATVIAMMRYQHIKLRARMFQGSERFWKIHIVVLGCVATAITTNRSFARGVNLTHSNEIWLLTVLFQYNNISRFYQKHPCVCLTWVVWIIVAVQQPLAVLQ